MISRSQPEAKFIAGSLEAFSSCYTFIRNLRNNFLRSWLSSTAVVPLLSARSCLVIPETTEHHNRHNFSPRAALLTFFEVQIQFCTSEVDSAYEYSVLAWQVLGSLSSTHLDSTWIGSANRYQQPSLSRELELSSRSMYQGRVLCTLSQSNCLRFTRQLPSCTSGTHPPITIMSSSPLSDVDRMDKFTSKVHTSFYPAIDSTKVELPPRFTVYIIGDSAGIGGHIAYAYAYT